MMILNLQELKGSYDLLLGIGSWCGPSLNLRRHNLRRFAFPLDWMVSNSVSDVTRLFNNKFQGFMEFPNLVQTEGSSSSLDDGVAVMPAQGGAEPVNAHFIYDTFYNITSVHDFPIVPNQDWSVHYPAYKEKLQKRISSLFEKLASSPKVLFIRWGFATQEEAGALYDAISQLRNGLPFNLLIMQPVSGIQTASDMHWSHPSICAVQVPLEEPNNNAIWDEVYSGLSVTSYWL
ncbi:DUF1796 family putative cysteine peptidase [Niallia taxi]|uniref:Peptidase n=1 Tax=Niallia taxi TaxID=2499688 RepID=A0A437K5M1_9BACI|nr:DUF1796 family putative cysteine peptidase [Niallia taxi]MCM3214239.1 papain-like cysteine peptidase [Niallia taxi]MED4040797.1 DUF1796 family putative cysteine peptidase [Niallia taxi]MED4052723.1 DUF1796 family putative cysteine peptidase [Niallia taxi]MED4120078.1 DUF1796 family putative cysteine peptidase [Niallia taxi]RVT58252.1 peptidase [Niallia taxi]